MLAQLKFRPTYFIIFFVVIFLSLSILLFFPKAEGFQYLNQFHRPWLDNFFITYTLAGDGLLSVITAVVLFLFKKRKEALTILLAFLLSGLIVQVIKNLIDQPRPKLYFEQYHIIYSNFVAGIDLHTNHSFPSGHTTSAFAMATIIALLSEKKIISTIAIIAAALVGYSRVYLAQHFLEDVLAGSIIGVLSAMYSYYIVWQRPLKIFERFNKKRSLPADI